MKTVVTKTWQMRLNCTKNASPIVKGGNAMSQIEYLTSKNTDWFTLAKGDNIFAFTADSGVTNLQFRIENKVIYEGV